MKLLKPAIYIMVFLLIVAGVSAQQTEHAQLRKQAQKAFADGNWKNAYALSDGYASK